MTQQFHPLVFTQKKLKLMFIKRSVQELELLLTHTRKKQMEAIQVSISSRLDKHSMCSYPIQ